MEKQDIIVENPDHINQADIIVGIPSYNEADSIALPTDIASQGLMEYFPRKKAVIINVDNNSRDGTKDAFMNTPTKVPKVYVSTPSGVKGKGSNLKNLFEATFELGAKAVIVIDADLKSITPHWIQYLGEPLFLEYDYVSPLYLRHKYDGSITNHIAYPLLRTLFGLRVRQPIGGDFGISGRMAMAFLSEKYWSESISNYGIDIWMTAIAIARRFKVCQAFLGSPKIHRPKDPANDLGPMFTEVIITLFDLMKEYEYQWKYITESLPSSIFGFGLSVDEKIPEINVNKEALYKKFVSGGKQYNEIWEKVIPLPEMVKIKEIKEMSCGQMYCPTDLWARILFNFAITYWDGEIPRSKTIEALIPLYYLRVLSFVNKTINMNLRECEEYFEAINRVFEKEKYYLIDRWDANQRKKGGKLFNHKQT